MNRPTRQLRKLKKLLNKNGFTYREEQNQIGMFGIDLVKIDLIHKNKEDFNTISIANGFGTKGGYDLDTNFKNQGLLEIYNFDTEEIIGNLKAKDALKYLKKERGDIDV